MEELINLFLTICDGDGSGDGDGHGSGYGDGDGHGSGSGSGDGHGSGYGDGHGSGYGDGDGHGSGYGDGYGSCYGSCSGSGDGSGDLSSVRKVCNDVIYLIDRVPTAFDNIKGNIAKCRILQADMTWKPCYVVRVGDCFAHGETVHDAHRDAMSKHMRSMSEDERIRMFTDKFPELDTQVSAKELFDWHNILTGSCMMGRQQWCRDHGINVESDTFTVKEFINLTKDSYGGNTIKKLTDFYN